MAWLADSRWLGLLAEYLIKTTAVMSVALAAAALLRRRSAALRHFVLSAFLVGLVLLPLLPSLPTGWETRLLPARPTSPDTAQGIPGGGTIEGIAGRAEIDRLEAVPLPAPRLSARGVLTLTEAPVKVRETAPDRTLTLRNETGNILRGRSYAGVAGRVLFAFWIAGLAALLLRLGLGLAGAARLSREGRPVDGPCWEVVLRQFFAMITLRRRVRLKSHGRVAVPMTWGIVRPVVLFPEDCRDWDEARRSAALFHELSHIKRADFAVMLFVRLSLALFWFNPLVWVVLRRLRQEQEKACDELVLRAGIRPSVYARSLLQFKRPGAGAWSPSAALLGLSAGSPIGDRLTAILRNKTLDKEMTMRNRIILAVAAVFVIALVGSARPAAAVPDRPAAASIGLAPSTAPAPAQETAMAVQEKQQVEKTKEAEKAEKEKKAAAEAEKKLAEKHKVTKTIFVTTPDAGKDAIRLSTIEGDIVKDLVLDRPSIVLEAAGPGDEVHLKINGNDVVLKKGDRLALEAKDGALNVLGEGDVHRLKVDVPFVVKVDTTTPQVFTIREDREPKIVKEIVIRPDVLAETVPPGAPGAPVPAAPATKAAPGVPAAPAPSAPPKKATGFEVLEDGKHYTIMMTPRAPQPPYPQANAYAVVPDAPGTMNRQEIRDRLRGVLEELKALGEKKPDVREDLKKVEESLNAITEKLGRTEAGLRVYYADGERGARYVKVMPKEGEGKEYTYSFTKAYPSQREKGMVYVGIGEGADFSVHYGGHHALDDKAAVERAIADVKKILPEGYGLESEADKDAETLILKIKVPEGQKDRKGLIKKIVAILEEDLKPAPAKKD